MIRASMVHLLLAKFTQCPVYWVNISAGSLSYLQKIGFNILCRLSLEIISMKCQSLFYGKKYKKSIKLSSESLLQDVIL